jgi:hypothetical protein
MSRTRWAALFALYAVASLVVMVFLGPQIPNCFGSVPTGQMSPECVAAWQASRSVLDRLLGTPLGAVVMFVALTAGTWLAVRLAGRPAHG